jgi:H+/Cl- antiporter ClcA
MTLDPNQKNEKRRLSTPLLFIVSILGSTLFFFIIIGYGFWDAMNQLEPGESTPGVGLMMMFLAPVGCIAGLIVGSIITYFVWHSTKN